MTLTYVELQDAVSAVRRNGGNTTAAALTLGVTRQVLDYRCRIAARKGIGTHFVGETPPGLLISGTSTLYDKEGEVTAQWIKTKVDHTLEEVTDAIREAFAEYQGMGGVGVPFTRAEHFADNLLTVYPLADLHLGMYAWKEETGEDYDISMAEQLLREAMGTLVSSSPQSETALILNLGDFFHSDSNENRTRRGGNALDVDTRYAKVLRAGVKLMVEMVERCLVNHEHVLVRNLQGNHDPYAALALTVALDAYFHLNKRVTIDTSPSPFFFHRFGKNLIGATHGDMAKPENMPGIMAASCAKDWGETEYRYVYCGHLHTSKKIPSSEVNGAMVEVFQTIAPKDAWSTQMGFVSGRSMNSITLSEKYGEISRLTYNVKGAR